MVVALAPFDRKLSAGKLYLHEAVGALEPRGCNRCGAGRRSASPGQARATLPGADRDVIAIDDMGEGNVGALGENRMIFKQRPEAGKIIGIDVVNPEDRVRVAHVHRRRRM